MHPIDPETQAAPLETLGRYQLLQKLGQGGMGTVYLATDTKLDRRVAVKILPPHAVNDADAVARFRREAKALAQLGHPGIVQAFDSDNVGDRHFLVMEYVEGASLATLLKERGRVPAAQAADTIYQAALALQHAHDKGLIHRDLKPSNLLVTKDGRVKLLDLGLARFMQDHIGDPELTREGAGMGTPDYAAPEQFRDAHHADVRSDIYSLGCTLYHLLAGQVPFPGSSMEEKYKSHQHRAPAPLAELCPDAPLGLLMVVERMMAKKPADRFPSAREVAEALAPFVGASSVQFEVLKNTLTWHSAKTTMLFTRPRSVLPWVGGAVAGVVLALLAVFWFWPPAEEPTPGPVAQRPPGESGRGKPPPKTEKEVKDDKKEPAKKELPKAVLWDDPNVLTVAQDGSAQYPSIGAALEKVQPGQTIRVLDDSDYREALKLTGPKLKGVTLEAVSQGRLVAAADKVPGLQIIGVSQLTVRGFRLKATAAHVALIEATDGSDALTLEDLVFEAGHPSYTAIELSNLPAGKEREPVLIQRCSIHNAQGGITVWGRRGKNYLPAHQVVVRHNQLVGCDFAISVMGEAHEIQVVANQILGATQVGIQLQHLAPDADRLLLANNTLLGCARGIRLWDSAVKGKDIRVCNNLLLGCGGEDISYLRDGGQADGKEVAAAWHLAQNWRELAKPPEPGTAAFQALVPLGATEKRLGTISGVHRDPKSVDFLRPDAGSPLAREGAGKTDPSLPVYIGARPPWGMPAWDWTRTWQVWPPGELLTVSETIGGGGQYRTVIDALKDAKPWATIRVLDAATYKGRLVLDSAARHRGLMIEAPRGAKLHMTVQQPRPHLIKDVPDVRLRGFKLISDPKLAGMGFIDVIGRVAGVVLEDLDLEGPAGLNGINLVQPNVRPGEPPVVIQRCKIQVGYDGIDITTGLPPHFNADQLPGGIVLHANRISNCQHRGIQTTGQLARLQVTHNLLWSCSQAGLQFQDLGSTSQRILVAQNTIYDCGSALRIWMNTADLPKPGQVAVSGNVLSACSDGDINCMRGKAGGMPDLWPEGIAAITSGWRFAGNWRDPRGIALEYRIAVSKLDRQLGNLGFVSVDPAAAAFLRPTPELYEAMAPLAPPGRPRYAGAVPPPGEEPWDWQRCGRW
jgi:serine/threonine protein kinase